jgi:hypothetical protein
MKTKRQIPVIPEEEQTPVVKGLLGLLEQFAERLPEQDEEIARLKDEISILKGEKTRPPCKPSKLNSQTDPDRPENDKSDAEGNREPKKRAGSSEKAKHGQLTLQENQCVAPQEAIPKGSRFTGYRDVVVQELAIHAHHTRYRLARWVTPEGEVLTGELPAALNNRHFGAQLISSIRYQHHHCQTTQPLLHWSRCASGALISPRGSSTSC